MMIFVRLRHGRQSPATFFCIGAKQAQGAEGGRPFVMNLSRLPWRPSAPPHILEYFGRGVIFWSKRAATLANRARR